MCRFFIVLFFLFNLPAFSEFDFTDKKYDIVKSMLSSGQYSDKEISETSKVSLEEIQNLKEQLDKNPLSLESHLTMAKMVLNERPLVSRQIVKMVINEIETKKEEDRGLLADAYHVLGSTYYVKKDGLKALEYYEQTIALNPQNSQVLKNLGRLYEYFSRFNDGKIAYEKALEIDPGNMKVQEYLKDLEEYIQANPDIEDLSESLKSKQEAQESVKQE